MVRFLVLGILLAGACADRSHLYSTTGLAYHHTLKRQIEDREVPAPRGVDAIDANIIMHNYRTMMMQKGAGHGGTAPGMLAFPGSPGSGAGGAQP